MDSAVLLQTRTQAEDVLFGDAQFGGEVLPADQSIIPGPTIGRQRNPDDPPNVVVSGWQIYDNKGRVVEKFEPCFSTGWDYEPEEVVKCGQKVTMFYDPRGQLILTVNPDQSETAWSCLGCLSIWPNLIIMNQHLGRAIPMMSMIMLGRTHGEEAGCLSRPLEHTHDCYR